MKRRGQANAKRMDDFSSSMDKASWFHINVFIVAFVELNAAK